MNVKCVLGASIAYYKYNIGKKVRGTQLYLQLI